MGKNNAVIVGDIDGGNAPDRIEMNDNLTADHIYDTKRWYPGYKQLAQLEAAAIWSNGISEEDVVPMNRLIECQDSNESAIDYGWVAVIVDARKSPPRVEYWHVKIDGVGFEVIETSPLGFPLWIQIQARFNEDRRPINFPVPHYPCKTYKATYNDPYTNEEKVSEEYIRDEPLPNGYGFFIIRNRGGKRGIQGPPQYLNLIMLIRKVYDIIENYATYSESQALAHLMVGLKNNTKPNRQSVKTQYDKQMTHRKIIIIGNEDWSDWVSPMNSAWDPWAMLEYIDKLIARETQMNKLMLEGDPAGHLSASETAINNWEARTKEKQIYWMGQYRPVLMACGAGKDVEFKDPSKPTFKSLMEGLQMAREAMIDIVENESIVDVFNEYLQKHGKQYKLTPISNEEMRENNNFGQSADNNGSEATQEE